MPFGQIDTAFAVQHQHNVVSRRIDQRQEAEDATGISSAIG